MNFELIKIVREPIPGGTSSVEVAYLFDKTKGRLIKTFVEDMTRGGSSLHSPVEVVYEAPTEVLHDVREYPRVENFPPHSTSGGLIPKGITKSTVPVRPELPDKPAPLRPPPHLAGVFIPEGNPGAAEERRMV